MDTKSNQISYQVAWKGAIDLVSSGRVELTSDDVGAEMGELADVLFAPLAVRLNGFGGTATATPIIAAPSQQDTAAFAAPAAPGAPAVAETFTPNAVEPPWLLTQSPCPDCQQNARTGVLIQNTDPAYKGPEFKCVLKRSTKQGSAWVETGLCQYQDWGRNSR